jgi:diguanylate cyclase (GGDEF)-like protein
MVSTLGHPESLRTFHILPPPRQTGQKLLINVYLAHGADASTNPPVGDVLRQTLAMAAAESEEELIRRTIDAARKLSPTGTGAIIDHSDAEAQAAMRLSSPSLARIGEDLVLVSDAPAELISLIGAHAQLYRDRLRRLDVLHHHANSDPLTGLRHHRPFSERLAAARPGRTAVIAIDVDGFKRINDEYGHQAGDLALVRLGDALQSALRSVDELYRIGGDEFAVIVDVQSAAEALSIADRLLQAARTTGHPVSVGVALCGPDEEGRATLRRADAALYEAKRAGRDKARLA